MRKYTVLKVIDYEKYEKKYRKLFEKLCRTIDRSYRGKDLSKRKPRNPIEERLLIKIRKHAV